MGGGGCKKITHLVPKSQTVTWF